MFTAKRAIAGKNSFSHKQNRMNEKLFTGLFRSKGVIAGDIAILTRFKKFISSKP